MRKNSNPEKKNTPGMAASESASAADSAGACFDAEIQAVRTELDGSFGQLDSALRHFARKDLAAAEPFPLAVVVLSAGLPAQDSDSVRSARIHLAAALEMLRIALTIHEELVASAAVGQTEKSFIGATILVGDYCFSRSASLAAQTDSPYVVTVFAEALKLVSEGRLRTLFSAQDAAADTELYREQEELCVAGAQAASYLAGLSAQESHHLGRIAAQIGQTLDRRDDLTGLYDRSETDHLPRHQVARWRHALAYLAQTDGRDEPSLGPVSGATSNTASTDLYRNGRPHA